MSFFLCVSPLAQSGAIVGRAEDLVSLRAEAALPEGFAAAEIKLEKGTEQTQRVLRDVYRLLMEEEEESSDDEANDSPFLALFRTANVRASSVVRS